MPNAECQLPNGGRGDSAGGDTGGTERCESVKSVKGVKDV
jgi:hypothetical protein